MVARFVWAWKNDEELYEVRSLLYPVAELDETTRRNHQQLAVNIVCHVMKHDSIRAFMTYVILQVLTT